MAEHTPGPWELSEDEDCYEILMGTALSRSGTYESHHRIKLACCDYDPDEPEDSPGNKQYDEAVSNALLVVASPELLAALESVPLPSVSEGRFIERFYTWYYNTQKPAIAKATGK